MNYFERKSMALDEATVRNIAKLARIRVPEAEVSSLAQELSNILDWIEQLNQVDTDDVTPMTSVTDTVMSKRADEITDGNYSDKVLANAPNPEGSFFTVPKVVE
tara:strand:- start:82 stop:393 length:312 start_codon:yes stop_codon:yes gene_type:complete